MAYTDAFMLISSYITLAIILLYINKILNSGYNVEAFDYLQYHLDYRSCLNKFFGLSNNNCNAINCNETYFYKHKDIFLFALLQRVMRLRDKSTDKHCRRLHKLIEDFALSVDLPIDYINKLKLLALFHDIGKIGIPVSVLKKPGPLTFSEYRMIQKHCRIGSGIARFLPGLAQVSDLILKHHERWDGRGYPLGLKEDEIPLECRILAIADAYDAMINDRPYRKALKKEEAEVEILKHSGSQFDPMLVQKFLNFIKTN